jgi:hypothetical protein
LSMDRRGRIGADQGRDQKPRQKVTWTNRQVETLRGDPEVHLKLAAYVGEVASLALGALAHSGEFADRQRGPSSLGAHGEQKGSILLPKVNIVHGLRLVKNLAGSLPLLFERGTRAIVTALAVFTPGVRSQF